MSSRRFTLSAVTLATLACAVAVHAAPAAKPMSKAPPKSMTMPALSRGNLDTTCAPCKDFNRYANGGWIDANTIPPAYSTWGSFSVLAERNRDVLHGILEHAANDKSAAPTSPSGMLGNYWCACMDSAAADAAGAKPIQGMLAELDAIASSKDLPARVAALHASGLSGMFSFRSEQDAKRSDLQIAGVGQGGLGLPDRDYYLRSDSAAVATRARYAEHIAKTFELLGDSPDKAKAAADAILGLETSLAKASMTNVQRRDPNAVYHKLPVDSLRALTPDFDWNAYLAARGVSALDSINIAQPAFIQALNGLITGVPIDAWKSYLRWKVVGDAAPSLSTAFADEDFRFSQVLSGAEAQQPRWKRCLGWADRDLGDLLGQAYVKQQFPPEARQRALDMVHNLEAALGDRIQSLDWMGPDTKTRALGKLHAFEEKIGYPNTWRDYAGVTVSRTDLVANRLASARYETKRNLTGSASRWNAASGS
jgi:predicted metalloendopeptidase